LKFDTFLLYLTCLLFHLKRRAKYFCSNSSLFEFVAIEDLLVELLFDSSVHFFWVRLSFCPLVCFFFPSVCLSACFFFPSVGLPVADKNMSIPDPPFPRANTNNKGLLLILLNWFIWPISSLYGNYLDIRKVLHFDIFESAACSKFVLINILRISRKSVIHIFFHSCDITSSPLSIPFVYFFLSAALFLLLFECLYIFPSF
jgi:hypothetical protein